MLGELVPCSGGEPIRLLDERVEIGRSETCDIRLQNPTISGSHCRLEFLGDAWKITDNDSSNGISVNGQKCRETALQPNDIVSIARLRYRIVFTKMSLISDRDRDDINREDPFLNRETAMAGLREERDSTLSLTDNLGTLTPCGGGDPIALFKPLLIVGRSRDCDLVLDRPTVSGQHCRLENKQGFWHVTDLESRNGIRLDGVRCGLGWILPGTILTIAKVRFEICYAPPPGATPPSTAGASGERTDHGTRLPPPARHVVSYDSSESGSGQDRRTS